jgi:hypothetical protein
MAHLRNFQLKAALGRAARGRENDTTLPIVSHLAARHIPAAGSISSTITLTEAMRI